VRKHGIEHEIRWTGWGKPFLTRRGKLVDAAAAAIGETTGRVPELSCTGGTSDGRFIADICPEVVELGPVNATIHKLNERVLVSDLEPLSRIYRGILERLLR
jgi:succinyl-diaminopimelate desuccinylase